MNLNFLDNKDPFGNQIHNPKDIGLTQEEIASIKTDIFMNAINQTLPDSDGVDFFFLYDFITNKMSSDFALIEHDFIKHCADKLSSFNEVGWYNTEGSRYENSQFTINQKVLRLIYNGAKIQDSYCLALINYLFKTYHFNEYKHLKRFSTIRHDEIQSLAQNSDGTINLFALGRLLGMCQFMGISLNENVYSIFNILSAKKNQFITTLFPAIKPFVIDECLFDEANETADECFDKPSPLESPESQRMVTIYKQSHKFIEAYLRHKGYSPQYVNNNILNEEDNPILQMAKAVSILKTLFPSEEFEQDEIIHYISIIGCIDALCNIADTLNNEFDTLSGNQITPVVTTEALFNPDNVIPAKKTVPEKDVHSAVPPVDTTHFSEDVYLQEISTLRSKLSTMTHEVSYLRSTLQTTEQSNRDLQSLVRKHESERYELIALRNYAYKSSSFVEYDDTKDISDYLPLLREHKIVIIGGHVGWINKLKVLLPNWTYIQPDSFRTVDSSILESKDRVYFFTDYLNHASYRKFISVLREKRLPIGYLGNNNINMMLAQIANDLTAQ